MQKWEYLQIYRSGKSVWIGNMEQSSDKWSVQQEMKKQGEQGWELVAVTEGVEGFFNFLRLIFKRPIV